LLVFAPVSRTWPAGDNAARARLAPASARLGLDGDCARRDMLGYHAA
jgi:hypothetical protein